MCAAVLRNLREQLKCNILERKKTCRYPQFACIFTTWIERYGKTSRQLVEVYLKQSYSQLMRFVWIFNHIFFPEELRKAATLKSSSVLVTHVRKQSFALSKSTCAKELTMANGQQSTKTLLFFFFHFVKNNNPTLILAIVNLMEN